MRPGKYCRGPHCLGTTADWNTNIAWDNSCLVQLKIALINKNKDKKKKKNNRLGQYRLGNNSCCNTIAWDARYY